MVLVGTDPLTRGGPSHRQHMLSGETLRYSPEVQNSNMTVCETQAEVFLSQQKARNSNGETTAVFHFLGRVQVPQFMVGTSYLRSHQPRPESTTSQKPSSVTEWMECRLQPAHKAPPGPTLLEM